MPHARLLPGRSVTLPAMAAVLVTLGASILPAPAPATPGGDTPPPFTLNDPDFLVRYAVTYHFRLGRPASVRAVPDGSAILFLRSGPRDFARDLYTLDPATGEERKLVSAADLLDDRSEVLSPEEKARRERMRLTARGVAGYDLSRDGARILIPLAGSLFVVERADGSVREIRSDAGYPVDARFSPDGGKVACVRNDEVWVHDLDTGRATRVTHGAGNGVIHGLAEFVAQEEMDRLEGWWWGPGSDRILFQETRTAGMEILHTLDPLHPEAGPGAAACPRAGTRNASVGLGIASLDGGPVTWVRWDSTAYEYLARVDWPEHGPLTLLVQNRAQSEERLLAVDPADGTTRTLLVERDPAWLNLERRIPHRLPDGERFLWVSERSGWPTMELRGGDGALIREVAGRELGFQSFAGYLPGSDEVLVSASTDPTRSVIYRVPLDPAAGEPAALSPSGGVWSVATEHDADLFVITGDGAQGDPRYEVCRRAGPVGVPVASVAERPGFVPRLELTTVGEAPTFHAAVVRPRNFQPGERYPVLISVYGGPGAQTVRAKPSSYLLEQWMADQGYVVVSVDGRGTPGRGRDWERATRGDLISRPMEDQAEALRLLAERYPEMDLARVGLYGWSFGGYFAAMGVLMRPDLFGAGAAVAPVTDWRDYDTHYTERFMGLPEANPEGYARSSALTYAAGLRKPLLLIHGTDDDNVYFRHSMHLADALFRAGRPFEILPLSGFTHMVADPEMTVGLYTRIMRFLDESLNHGPIHGPGGS